MMKIKKPQSQEELDIYSAIVKFTKEKNGHISENVRVIIRYGKKGHKRKKDLQVPGYIDTDELNWTKYKKEGIAVYHRVSNGQNYDYIDNRRICVHTILRENLEKLVSEVCFGNSNKHKNYSKINGNR